MPPRDIDHHRTSVNAMRTTVQRATAVIAAYDNEPPLCRHTKATTAVAEAFRVFVATAEPLVRQVEEGEGI